MLTNQLANRQRIDLPHEPGQYVSVKPLSLPELQEAKRVRTMSHLTDYPIEFTAALRKETEAAKTDRLIRSAELGLTLTEPEPVVTVSDPVDDYDAATVLRYAVQEWSYPEPVTPENVDALDPVTADYLLRKLLPTVESEEDRKNGLPPTTTRLRELAPLMMTGGTDGFATKDSLPTT